MHSPSIPPDPADLISFSNDHLQEVMNNTNVVLEDIPTHRAILISSLKMKCPITLSILSTISVLATHSCVTAIHLFEGVYAIRSQQGFYLVDSKSTLGELANLSRESGASSSPAAQWTVVRSKASNPNLFSIQNRQSNLYLSLDHSSDNIRNPYTNDEPIRMQKEYQDWYLDTTMTPGYYDIESPVMGHQEKSYAIKSPEGDVEQGNERGLSLKAVDELSPTHRGWLFEAVQ
ncbi:hypothetical protein BGZ96_006680 [Linnemannia gamsii]|uniref:Ricin B lectin domain-containing protein n=1 Tax=Linnemannia gamsii TaxID=64522 RepID=A0ABQ7K1Y8_9FUNG|nr:hypothetical protein BGZ96_006680 [Linnemannia gamsii]